ncbi:hypothetical protein QUB60_06000 [Microcoleus sp. A2-C5]
MIFSAEGDRQMFPRQTNNNLVISQLAVANWQLAVASWQLAVTRF